MGRARAPLASTPDPTTGNRDQGAWAFLPLRIRRQRGRKRKAHRGGDPDGLNVCKRSTNGSWLMSSNVTKLDDGNKTAELSNPGKLLRAYMQATGIHCAKALADSLGIKLRTIQRLKLEIACANDAKCAISGAANNANDAINGVSQQSDGKKVSPTPPSKNNSNLEQPLKPNSNVAARGVAAALPMDARVLEKRIIDACNGSLANPAAFPGLLSMSTPMMWLDHGADLERDVIPALTVAGKKNHGKGIRSWDYFTPMVAEAKAKRERGLPPVTIAAEQTDRPKKSRTLADAMAARRASDEVTNVAN